jgi:hypothetical protein
MKKTTEETPMIAKQKRNLTFKVGIGLLITLFVYITYQKIADYEENKPRIATELNDIKLNEKLSDVLFKNEGYKIDKDEDRPNYIMYTNDAKLKQFKVENGLVKRIARLCEKTDTSTTFEKIKCGDSGDSVLKKYGHDINTLCRLKDDEYKEKLRMYDVEKYGIRFGIEYNKVRAFIITEPNKVFEESSHSWGSCE